MGNVSAVFRKMNDSLSHNQDREKGTPGRRTNKLEKQNTTSSLRNKQYGTDEIYNIGEQDKMVLYVTLK